MNPHTAEVFVPLGFMLLFFGTIIVKMLTHHQRQMAELIHGKTQGTDPALLNELRAMRQELAELRERTNLQSLALEQARERFETPIKPM